MYCAGFPLGTQISTTRYYHIQWVRASTLQKELRKEDAEAALNFEYLLVSMSTTHNALSTRCTETGSRGRRGAGQIPDIFTPTGFAESEPQAASRARLL